MNELRRKIEQETAKYLGEPIVLIGSSNSFKKVLESIQTYADCDENVFIYGDVGTGKTEIAKAIHCLSSRRSSPFVLFSLFLKKNTK